VNERFACEIHAEKQLDRCEWNQARWETASSKKELKGVPACRIVPLRTYLAERKQLRTGKTR